MPTTMPRLADRVFGGGRWALAIVVAACALAAVIPPSAARADGDPASDVLLSQSYFLPPDVGASVTQLRRLVAVLDAAQHAGYPVRVAVIASPSDLGSVTALWRQPHSYVRFLAEELALVSPARSRVLVVMPNGLGLFSPGATTAADQAIVATATPPAGGSGGLATTAISAIARLAAADGHRLPSTVTTPAGQQSSGGSTSTGSVVAFIVGLILIAAAWTASIRARPLSRRLTSDGP